MPAPRVFAYLHALARRYARRPDEADDLLQSALLAAIEAERTDFAAPDTRRWLVGVMRNHSAFEARTAVRRRRRDAAWSETRFVFGEPDPGGGDPIEELSPALRLTARLALAGHTRQEIGWLLGLSDEALRQRISQIRRALKAAPGAEPTLSGALAFGRIRAALHRHIRHRPEAFLASHDPDGHLFVVGRSRFAAPRQQTDG